MWAQRNAIQRIGTQIAATPLRICIDGQRCRRRAEAVRVQERRRCDIVQTILKAAHIGELAADFHAAHQVFLNSPLSNLAVKSVRLIAKLVVPALLGWSRDMKISAYGVPGGGGSTKSLPRNDPVTKYSKP